MNRINVVPTISNPNVSPMTEKVKLPCDIIDNEMTLRNVPIATRGTMTIRSNASYLLK